MGTTILIVIAVSFGFGVICGVSLTVKLVKAIVTRTVVLLNCGR